MTLTADEFIRRFLFHVVPKGFIRIRHYGILGNRCRPPRVAVCRRLFAQPALLPLPYASAATVLRRLTGIDIERCPQCHQGRLVVIATLHPLRPPGLVSRPLARHKASAYGTYGLLVHRGDPNRHVPRASPGRPPLR